MEKRICMHFILFLLLTAVICLMAAHRSVRSVQAEDTKAPFKENGKRPYRILSENTFLMDFDSGKTLKEYGKDGAWLFSSISGGEISDGHFYAAKEINISGKNMPGDDYGAEDSIVCFDLSYQSGTFEVGMRKILDSDTKTDSGIWFTFREDSILVEEQSSGIRAVAKGGAGQDMRLKFVDTHDILYLYQSKDNTDQCLLYIEYNEKDITVKDGAGNMLQEKTEHNNIPRNGYFTVNMKSFQGYIDNLSYNRFEIDFALPEADRREVDYSAWIASDDIGRETPLNSDVGGKRNNKYVGLFYFLCNEYTGQPREVRDFTRMYLKYGVDYIKEHIKTSPGGYWAEPFFGYYINRDEWVYRKHAYMLQQAGVDFIFLDMSNAAVYKDAHIMLFDTWLQIRKEGGQTPQIVCMTGDMPSTLVIDLYTLMNTVYSKPEYQELFFIWDGKPLILGNNDSPDGSTWSVSTGTTPQTPETFYAEIKKNKKVAAYYDSGKFAEDLSNFTVRKCWAWQADKHEGYWNWLDHTPQAFGTDFNGRKEQLSVSMGEHAHTNRGRSYVNGDSSYDRNGDFGFSYGKAQYGLHFAEQFENALKQDPQVLMITGWNEWYAGVHDSADPNQLTGGTVTPNRLLVDQFTPEYSRDGEPMKVRGGVGFGDNYYYQMVHYIRRFKGIGSVPVADGTNAHIKMQDDAEWEDVTPEYRDTIGDTAYRNQVSFQTEYRYQNSSGRNDLNTAKVTQDSDSLYFHITTVNELVTSDDSSWMNLYLNLDNDAKTGWEGYDFILNRSRDGASVSIEKFVDNGWNCEQIGSAEYTMGTNSLTIKVAKDILRREISGADFKKFQFKWADHSVTDGDVMRFMDLGDTAPNDRFNFLYTTEKLPEYKAKKASWITMLCICLSAAVLTGAGIFAFAAQKRKRN